MKKVKKFFTMGIVFVMLFSMAMPVSANTDNRMVYAEEKSFKVLFIGNSITYLNTKGKKNHYIKYLKGMAQNEGITLKTYKLTKSGSNLSYWTEKRLRNSLKARKYDYIVIQ